MLQNSVISLSIVSPREQINFMETIVLKVQSAIKDINESLFFELVENVKAIPNIDFLKKVFKNEKPTNRNCNTRDAKVSSSLVYHTICGFG